jgi:hypothetical protein
VQVYVIACYVEGAKAVKEFGIRARGGFFEDAGTSQYADAVLDAACAKMLLIEFVRDLEGATLVEACALAFVLLAACEHFVSIAAL